MQRLHVMQVNQWEYLYYQHLDGSIPTEYWVGAEAYYRGLVAAKPTQCVAKRVLGHQDRHENLGSLLPTSDHRPRRRPTGRRRWQRGSSLVAGLAMLRISVGMIVVTIQGWPRSSKAGST